MTGRIGRNGGINPPPTTEKPKVNKIPQWNGGKMKIPVSKVPELLDKLGMTEEDVKEMVAKTRETIEKAFTEESQQVKERQQVKVEDLILTEFPVKKAIEVIRTAGIDPDSFNSVLEMKSQALAVLYETFFGRISVSEKR